MKRITIFAAAALLAAGTGCSDTPTAPAADGLMRSVVQSGNGNAWHGYETPLVTWTGGATPLELCATWNDAQIFTRESGRFAGTDFFSYEFFQAAANEGWTSVGSARNAAGTTTGCYVVPGLEAGVYLFRVEAMARHGKGKATTTHHASAWTGEVRIGESESPYSVGIAPELARIGVGGTRQFSAVVRDADDIDVPGPVLTWSSDDSNVATVDADGLASGHARGTARISVEFAGIRADATLTVRSIPVVQIAIPTADAEFELGVMITFSGSATDSEENPLTGAALVWTSDVDGEISTGTGFSRADLSAGDHTITLIATDGEGLIGTETVSIVVAAQTVLVAALAAGYNHTCGLTSAGAAYCWGRNFYGGLGDGTTTERLTPVAVAGGLSFSAISVGLHHTVGLTSTGQVYAWGFNSSGQLGDGTSTDRHVPTLVSSALAFKAISAGGQHTVALTTAGAAYAWGLNFDGGLGDGTSIDRDVPTAVSGGLAFEVISAGGEHTVALTAAGVAYAWGHNRWGQLGDATTTRRLVPTAVWGGFEFHTINAGEFHTVAVTTDGAGYAWGYAAYGQLGNGSDVNQRWPVAISGDLVFTTISAGGSHSAGLTTSGEAYAWGFGSYGQLGNGSTSGVTLEPVAVTGGFRFKAISLGEYHSVGISVENAAYAWGSNVSGRLGDGTTTQRLVPVPVAIFP
jgi:alpha-tubulin suppressor-like RCC1 family protein